MDAFGDTGFVASDTSDEPIALYDIVTETLVSRFEAAIVPDGIELSWQLGGPELFASLRIERSAAANGPWEQLDAAPITTAGVSRLLDTTAEPGATYRYRLIATKVGGGETSLGTLSVQAGVAVKDFDLLAVSPNPGDGRVSIEYAVPREADVRVSVVDLQGRTVANLVNGIARPGIHVARWNGILEGGEPAPAGVYFIHFRSPAKAITRRVVRVRP